jgi:hypothetical protein
MDDKDADTVFEIYKDRLNYLQRAVLIFIGVSLFFFFMVLFPYFSLKYDAFRLSDLYDYMNNTLLKDVTNVQDNEYNQIIMNIRELFDQKMTDSSNLSSLSERLNQYYNYLINYSRQNNSISNSQNQIFPECNQENDFGTYAWINCNVLKKNIELQSQIGSGNKTVSKAEILTITSPVINKLEGAIKHIDIAKAKSKDLLNADVFESTRAALQNVVHMLRNPTKDGNITITEGKVALNNIKANLQTQKDIIKNNIDNATDKLVKRFDTLEAPIVGNIPMGFNEMIAIFPIVLVIGFSFCSSILCEIIRLRKVVHKVYDKKSIFKDIETDATVVAPMWVDPTKRKRDQLISLSILIIPVPLFLLSTVFICLIWFFMPMSNDKFPAFLGAVEINKWMYTILYIASAVYFS